MVVAQAPLRTKEAEITEQDSLLLTRNLLRIAIFNISYIRGLFPEKYFNDKSVPALEMKIKKLMPMDAESRRLIDWMEKGVYDALQKKYLKTLLFCICEKEEGPMMEEYAFSFSYPTTEGDEVSMNISRRGTKHHGVTLKANGSEITPDQMRSSACKMVRTLVQLMQTLDRMPEERTILMKLLYYDDVTPEDYEPPFFRGCNENEVNSIWLKNPLKMQVGHVNSKHLILALKVKSVLDPCEDENGGQDNDASLGEDSGLHDDSSDSEIHPSLADQFVVAPAGEKNKSVHDTMGNDENTEDNKQEEETASRMRVWIDSRNTDTFDLANILESFPEISVQLAEDIIIKLLDEGLIANGAKDSYIISKRKVHSLQTKNCRRSKILESEVTAMETDDDNRFDFNAAELPFRGQDPKDGSTCAALHSIGSETTRTRGRSNLFQNGSIRSGQTPIAMPREHGNTPISRPEQPISSVESGVNRKNAQASGRTPLRSKRTDGSSSSQDNRSRKTSTVKEPIIQYKRQKSQVA